jgi:hypothetical protein
MDNHDAASEPATVIANDKLRTCHLFYPAWNDCTSDSTGPVQANVFSRPLTVAARLLRQIFITRANPSTLALVVTSLSTAYIFDLGIPDNIILNTTK